MKKAKRRDDRKEGLPVSSPKIPSEFRSLRNPSISLPFRSVRSKTPQFLADFIFLIRRTLLGFLWFALVNQVGRMSARVSRGVPSRGSSRSAQRRKVVVNVDLNIPAPENHDEGTSNYPSTSNVVPNTQGLPPQPVPIDVDLIDDDDDVLISSPGAFAEAKDKSRRNRRQRIVDVDAEASSSGTNNRNKRHRVPGNQQVINCEIYVNLECEAHNSRGHSVRHKDQTPPPPPPPKEPAISCPICMSTLVEEVTTKCGHIFCKGCIKAALAVKNQCPTCRRKMSMKDTIRIYLPTRN